MNVSSVSLTSIQAMFYQTQYRSQAAPGVRAQGEGSEAKGKDQINFSAQAKFLGGQVQQGPPLFKELAEALESGDLAGAREAFAALEQRIQARQAEHHVNQGKPQERFSLDFAALGSALESGDLDAAQQAFSALLENLPSARPHPRHPHGEPPASARQAPHQAVSGASASLLAMTYTSITVSSSEADSNPSSSSIIA